MKNAPLINHCRTIDQVQRLTQTIVPIMDDRLESLLWGNSSTRELGEETLPFGMSLTVGNLPIYNLLFICILPKTEGNEDHHCRFSVYFSRFLIILFAALQMFSG